MLPTPEQLRRLLLDTTPVVYYFESGETRDEREARMDDVPADAQRAAQRVMVTRVLDWLDLDGADAARPLLYYMATEDESVSDADEDARQTSYDWRLTLYGDGGLFFCDFNGWPGDNEIGGGVLWHAADPDTMTTVFTNCDCNLTADCAAYEAVVAEYERSRAGTPVEPPTEVLVV